MDTLGQTFVEIVIGFGVFCGALTVIITTIVLVGKLPPIRWLWRHLISGPIAEFWTAIIKEGASEFHEESVAPQITAIEAKVDELVAQGETSWHKDKSWIHGRLKIVEERQRQLIVGITTALQSSDDGDEVRDIVLGVLASMLETEKPKPTD